MRVHLATEPTTEDLADLRQRLPPGLDLHTGPLDGPVDVYVGGRPEEADLARVRQALVVPYAGLPARTRRLLLARWPDLPVYNLHHNAPAVAEHAVGLLLAAARCLLPMDRRLRAHDWRPRYAPDPGVGLHGRTAVVLGMGAIGRRVAPVLEALGMSVRGVRRQGDGHHAGVDQLDALLPGADALICCLPHTDDTDGLLDARRLALLPAHAVFVNVGRAGVVDPQALYTALRDGRLHSAGLDVWWCYPADEAARQQTAPAPQPFEALDNVVLSPHRAGHGPHVELRRRAELAALLAALARGEDPATHRVVPARGY